MSEQNDNRLIFDRALVKARRRRFGPEAPSFLSDFALEELNERLAAVTRRFETICALNAAPGLAEAVRASGKADRLITLDSAGNLLSPGAGLQVVADDELLPLADKSVSCILSVLLKMNFIFAQSFMNGK